MDCCILEPGIFYYGGPIVRVLLFLAVAVASVLVGCSSDKGTQAQSIQIPVKGDPLTFVANTAGDESGLPASLFASDREWLIYKVGFATEPQERVADMVDAESKNAAPTAEATTEVKTQLTRFKMDSQPVADGGSVVFASVNNEDVILQFKRSGQKLFLDNIGSTREDLSFRLPEFRVHHYSIKQGQDAFSVLFSFKIEDRSFLLAYYFTAVKETNVLTQTLSSAYNFLFGPGVKMAWSQERPLNMKICTQGTLSHYKDLATKAVAAWKTPLRKRLSLTSQEVKTPCPPFSDLNTQTIFHVKDWVKVYDKMMAAAFVPAIPDFHRSEIVDADIFVLEAEWNEAWSDGTYKMDDSLFYGHADVQSAYSETLTHEMGHVLGLHHVFDGNHSVMSYSNVSYVTSYDRGFVQELYPEYEPVTAP